MKKSFIILTCSMLLVSCGSAQEVLPTVDMNAVSTEMAQTAWAMVTETARANLPSTSLLPSATLEPISTPTLLIIMPTSTTNHFTKLIVLTGELAQHADTYSNYDEVFVTKKDGSIDERPNDLEELCLDWLFYRDKILEYTQAGQNENADDARAAWNEINYWLDEYDEADWQTMFTIIEKRGE